MNDNGEFDLSEVGLSGVTVELFNSSGGLIATTTTNSAGDYTFAEFTPGTYRIEVVTPPGGVVTAQPAAFTFTVTQSLLNENIGIFLGGSGGSGSA